MQCGRLLQAVATLASMCRRDPCRLMLAASGLMLAAAAFQPAAWRYSGWGAWMWAVERGGQVGALVRHAHAACRLPPPQPLARSRAAAGATRAHLDGEAKRLGYQRPLAPGIQAVLAAHACSIMVLPPPNTATSSACLRLLAYASEPRQARGSGEQVRHVRGARQASGGNKGEPTVRS